MPNDLKLTSLLEISQELARFDLRLSGKFLCPACFKELPIDSEQVTEEHIVPRSAGGLVTTFLCNSCNSTFGRKQTRWLSDWITLNEGNAPFHENQKLQRARLSNSGREIGGSLRMAEDGAIEFISDISRSNPNDFGSFWSESKPSEIEITHSMPVFAN